jgi:hypothetical protein
MQQTGQTETTAFETDAAPAPEVADEGEPHAITEKQTGIKKVCALQEAGLGSTWKLASLETET